MYRLLVSKKDKSLTFSLQGKTIGEAREDAKRAKAKHGITGFGIIDEKGNYFPLSD